MCQMEDRSSDVPAYRRVAADLRAKIESGEYAAGAALPSERALTEVYGVSRPTIRDALGVLRSEGVVTAEHGRGVFVRPPRALRRLAADRLSRAARERDQGAFLGDTQAGDWVPSSTVRVYFEKADPDTAELLGIAEGDEVTVRDRLMKANDEPVQIAVSRLPRDITRDTAMEDKNTGPGGLYARLEDAGHTLGKFSETIAARMPTADEARLLALGEGTPVITVTRLAYDATGRAVEVNAMTLAADRYELVYDIPAG